MFDSHTGVLLANRMSKAVSRSLQTHPIESLKLWFRPQNQSHVHIGLPGKPNASICPNVTKALEGNGLLKGSWLSVALTSLYSKWKTLIQDHRFMCGKVGCCVRAGFYRICELDFKVLFWVNLGQVCFWLWEGVIVLLVGKLLVGQMRFGRTLFSRDNGPWWVLLKLAQNASFKRKSFSDLQVLMGWQVLRLLEHFPPGHNLEGFGITVEIIVMLFQNAWAVC